MSQNSNRTPLGGGEGAGIGRFAGLALEVMEEEEVVDHPC